MSLLEMEKKKKKPLKKELLEWGIMLSIIGILYFTGLHTEVIGKVQSLVLKTGLIKPAMPEESTTLPDADYRLNLTDFSGKTIDFSEFEEKTIFMNFWATWCPPCIAEMPEIQNLYQDLKQHENIVFVMINLDDDMEKAKEFIKRKEYDFPNYRLGSNLPKVYESQSIPTTFVISPAGKVVVSKKGMASYDNKKFKEFLLNL